MFLGEIIIFQQVNPRLDFHSRAGYDGLDFHQHARYATRLHTTGLPCVFFGPEKVQPFRENWRYYMVLHGVVSCIYRIHLVSSNIYIYIYIIICIYIVYTLQMTISMGHILNMIHWGSLFLDKPTCVFCFFLMWFSTTSKMDIVHRLCMWWWHSKLVRGPLSQPRGGSNSFVFSNTIYIYTIYIYTL